MLARRPCVGGEERGGEEEGGRGGRGGKNDSSLQDFGKEVGVVSGGRRYQTWSLQLLSNNQLSISMCLFVFLRVPSEALEGQRVRDEETRRTIFKDVIV